MNERVEVSTEVFPSRNNCFPPVEVESGPGSETPGGTLGVMSMVGSSPRIGEGFPEGSIDGNELVEGTLDRDGWRLRVGTRVGLLLLVGLDDGATLVVGVKLGMCDGLSLGGKDGDEDGSIDGD